MTMRRSWADALRQIMGAPMVKAAAPVALSTVRRSSAGFAATVLVVFSRIIATSLTVRGRRARRRMVGVHLIG